VSEDLLEGMKKIRRQLLRRKTIKAAE